MAYLPPMLEVYLTARQAPAVLVSPRRAYLAGGSAWLARYDVSAERARGFLGDTPSSATSFLWPNLPVGATADRTTDKLVARNALLRYATITSNTHTIETPSRINFADGSGDLVLASGNSYTRESMFGDRDVAAGDIVTFVQSPSVRHTAKILRVYAKPPTTPVSYGSLTVSPSNPTAQSASATPTFVVASGTAIPNFAVTASAAAYNGLPSGFITETYLLTCTQASTGGDPTTARFSVVSASGTDNQAEITPAASGAPFAVGTRGATATVTVTSAQNVSVGHAWSIVYNGAYAVPGATVTAANPNPAPSRAVTYVISVLRGGLYAGSVKPIVRVTTTDGTDTTSEIVVASTSTVVPLNSYGTTFVFTGTGLRYGDQFTVVATPTAAGKIGTIDIDHDLPNTIDNTADVEFHIVREKLTIPESPATGVTNWSSNGTGIDVAASMQVYDATWTVSGVPALLPLVADKAGGDYSKLYADYRAWYPAGSTVRVFQTSAELDALLPEAAVPENPLKFAAVKALAVANGTPICLGPVGDPEDLTSWAATLAVLTNDARTGLTVAELVPLTTRPDVLALFSAHVAAMSSPQMKAWRRAWFTLTDVSDLPIVHTGTTIPRHVSPTTSDGLTCLATFGGTGNKTVICTSANGNFVANGVRPGDIVRAQYVGGAYASFVIATVDSADRFTTVTGPATPIGVGAKIEIWRRPNAAEEATELALQSGSYGSELIRTVLPHSVEAGGLLVPGYIRAVVLAGLASGVLQHQSLINLAVTGVTDDPTIRRFGAANMNILADGGITLLDQDPTTGTIFCRDALTTAAADTDFRDEMVVRNFHTIGASLADVLDKYIGKTNAVDETLTQLRVDLGDKIRDLQQTVVNLLGSPLLDGTEITRVAISDATRDAVELSIDCVLPRALRRITLRLQSV